MKYLARLLPILRAYRRQVLLSFFTLLILTGLSLAIPSIIQQVIDVGLAKRETGYLLQMALVLLVIGILRALLNYLQRYVNEWMAQHIGYDLRNHLYDHIQHLPFRFHDHSQTGQLISRCIEDVRSIQQFASQGLVEIIRLILLMIGIIAILFIENPRLAPIALLPLIPLVWITTNYGRTSSGMFWAVDNALGELSSRLQENVVGAQVVRAFAREQQQIEHFAEANRALYQARVSVNREWAKVMSSSQFLVIAGTLLILWFGGNMVLKGQMSVGEVVAFNSYLLMLSAPAQQLTWVVSSMGEASAGLQRTFEILDLEPEIKSPSDPIFLPQMQGEVEFDHVDLNYEGGTAHALKDIHLKVRPNQVVALIGMTGSGKTSLVNLIPRFYDVTGGCVRIDGQDVRSLDLISYRKQIGIVLQTSLLFSASVCENIAYGRPDASDEEILAAARAAQAHDFILELPQGYDTVVGERGVTLSGGQRQRVAIARALLMNPRILILDDSTSSVDTQTERLIQKALDQLMEGRTTFVIAHRLSTVRRADLILVMDGGHIVERGTHQRLLMQNGLYRQIYELQLKDQEQFRETMETLEVRMDIELPKDSLDE